MSSTVNLVDLQPGARVRLADGAIAEVIENPQDGIWITCRYLSHPTEPGLVGDAEQQIFATDIEAYADPR
ncbi:hypothetical protein [Bordetella genomosp. 13]|uniref:DUF2158 domain-containing protein n=1 Tax=Bordetella genomosp. 13 TaxID=463040 RepID=A0A1W6ZI74_9BORD|nr:hypothetical protein [Bordetella genomosp. 13]ARP96840.1 hypothetical protein CAL15_22220 [Bordetella genomosp. 13]